MENLYLRRTYADLRNAVNDLRVARGLRPIQGDQIARAELSARGEWDYARAFAQGCADLTRDEQ